MTCMESMTRICGLIFSKRSQIRCTDVSINIMILSAGNFRRLARSAICCSDSSPDTYKTLTPRSAILAMACNNKVLLPAPGAPPNNTTLPVTMPPPKTRSSSEMPVEIRSACDKLTSDNNLTSLWLPA